MKKLILILSLVCCPGFASCANNKPQLVASEKVWMYVDDIYRVVKLDSVRYMMIVNYNRSGRLVPPVVFNKETNKTISLDTDIK